jgi:tRNA 2-thiouridine synthesizing protein A
VVRLLASDPMAEIDVPHFCAEQGHRLLASEMRGAATVFFVAKG